jgi:2-polyprenyl-3-methyl-5-hydroxy-6-metoxy-1,4-benzoquinol methylase
MNKNRRQQQLLQQDDDLRCGRSGKLFGDSLDIHATGCPDDERSFNVATGLLLLARPTTPSQDNFAVTISAVALQHSAMAAVVPMCVRVIVLLQIIADNVQPSGSGRHAMNITFGLKVLGKSLQHKDCPYCGSRRTNLLARKHGILQLRQCPQCRLQFRYPKDTVSQNSHFYQDNYKQKAVTDMPTESALPRHIQNNFSQVGRDLTEHLGLIRQFSSGTTLLDFGASWGYCTYQFKQAGFDAVGYEISRPRAAYGEEHLQLKIATNSANLANHSFDIIYSAHVLEHLPDPKAALEEMLRLIAPGGTIFIFVPNGASEPARRLGVAWPPLINEKHVMAYTPEFLANAMFAEGFAVRFASSPYAQLPRTYTGDGQFDGEELLAIWQSVIPSRANL